MSPLNPKARQNLIIVIAAIAILLVAVLLKNARKSETVVTGDYTIALWELENEESQKALDEAILKFTEQYPNIRVARNHYPPEDLRQQFQTAALGKGGADIVIASNDLAGPFSVMGIIHPLQNEFDFSVHDDAVVNAVKDDDGNIWALPFSKGNHLMLMLNKKLIPNEPASLEKLIEEAKKISDPAKKMFGLVYDLNEPFWFVTFLSAFGGYPYENGKAMLDTQPMKGALAYVKSLKFDEKVIPSDCNYDCADTLFVEGKSAAIINGDWSIQKYEAAFKDDLVILPLPKSEKTGNYMRPMISGKYVFFNANLEGDRYEAVKKLAAHLVSDESQKLYVERTRRLPSLKTGQAVDLVNQDKVLSDVFASMEHGQPMPMAVAMRAIWDAVRPQLQSVMSGRATPDDAAKQMQKDAESKMKDI